MDHGALEIRASRFDDGSPDSFGGPDAFVMNARSYRDFARAMRLKLLQEIRGAPLG